MMYGSAEFFWWAFACGVGFIGLLVVALAFVWRWAAPAR